jgi:hypothetical protein
MGIPSGSTRKNEQCRNQRGGCSRGGKGNAKSAGTTSAIRDGETCQGGKGQGNAKKAGTTAETPSHSTNSKLRELNLEGSRYCKFRELQRLYCNSVTNNYQPQMARRCYSNFMSIAMHINYSHRQSSSLFFPRWQRRCLGRCPILLFPQMPDGNVDARADVPFYNVEHFPQMATSMLGPMSLSSRGLGGKLTKVIWPTNWAALDASTKPDLQGTLK